MFGFQLDCSVEALRLVFMVWWKCFLLGSVLWFEQGLFAQEYGLDGERQVLPNGRYEPRRPGEVHAPERHSSSVVVSQGRYAPTRPEHVRRRSVLRTRRDRSSASVSGRSEPTRPVLSVYEDSGIESESSRFLETQFRNYRDDALIGFDREQMAVLQEQFLDDEIEKRAKGKLLGKIVTFPVKLVYQVSKKVIGKLAIEWWVPLL